MFFSKAVTALTYEDVESLTLTGEPESLVLDYKACVEGADRDKKELAKDVSAMANSSGGYIVVGVAEKQGKPVHPPCGTSRMIGRQKVEEWVEQILISNVAQRPPIVIRVVDVPGSADKCVVVINTSVSSRAPHMVTVDHRYFKRHEFHSLPAEEYEVREMFERARRLRSETEQYLSARNYLDVMAPHFCENMFSAHLYMRNDTEEGPVIPAQSFATFISCPDVLISDAINPASEELWQWLTPDARIYPPSNDRLLPIGEKRPVFDGVLQFEEYTRKDRTYWHRYLLVAGNGFTEMGLSPAVRYKGKIQFSLVDIVGRFWQFIALVAELYRFRGLLRPFTIMLNMKGTAGSVLYNLGEGWREPDDWPGDCAPECLDGNLQFVVDMNDPDVDAAEIEHRIREIAARIDAAYGSRNIRSFNHINADSTEAFPHRKMHR